MYSITENIYCSQLSSVAILLQPKLKYFTSYSTRKGLGSLSPCAIALRSSPPSHVSTCNGQRSSQLFCVHYSCNSRLALRVDFRELRWEQARTRSTLASHADGRPEMALAFMKAPFMLEFIVQHVSGYTTEWFHVKLFAKCMLNRCYILSSLTAEHTNSSVAG
jgi:hypothetical protein